MNVAKNHIQTISVHKTILNVKDRMGYCVCTKHGIITNALWYRSLQSKLKELPQASITVTMNPLSNQTGTLIFTEKGGKGSDVLARHRILRFQRGYTYVLLTYCYSQNLDSYINFIFQICEHEKIWKTKQKEHNTQNP